MLFSASSNNKANIYAILAVVIVAVLLIVLGYVLLRDVLFPMLISAIWALFLDVLKKVVRDLLFSSE